MSLIDDIKGMLGNEVVSRVASSLGVSPTQAQSAVNAAVPSMLSGVIDLAGKPGGADKLESTLKKIDLSSLTNPAQSMQGSGFSDIGSKLLGGLFGSSVLGGLGDLIGKSSGIGSMGSKLISMIAPIVLGALAKKWMSGGGSAQGLMSLLNQEKSSIAAAMPAGLSLGNVFGAMSAPSMPNVPTPDAGGLAKLLIPLGLIALLALGAWWWFNRPSTDVKISAPISSTPKTPTVSIPEVDAKAAETATKSVTDMFDGLTKTVTEIKDEASLTAALPKIKEFQDGSSLLKAAIDKLPASAKTTLMELIKSKLASLNTIVANVMKIPGLAEKAKPVQGLLDTITAWTK